MGTEEDLVVHFEAGYGGVFALQLCRIGTRVVDHDGGYLGLTGVVIELLHVDAALGQHDLAIDAAHTHVSANADRLPTWNPGDEFQRARDTPSQPPARLPCTRAARRRFIQE